MRKMPSSMHWSLTVSTHLLLHFVYQCSLIRIIATTADKLVVQMAWKMAVLMTVPMDAMMVETMAVLMAVPMVVSMAA